MTITFKESVEISIHPELKDLHSEDNPTLTPFFPKKNKFKAAIIVCPGGGYGCLADHEGTAYAEYFNSQGIAAFVLKYRLGSNGHRHPSMLSDAARAVRLVRNSASELGIDPNKIGIIGSSAGGHLVSTIMTQYDSGNPDSSDSAEKQSSRPDFGILCYPVISSDTTPHIGSFNNLLGEEASQEERDKVSAEKNVTSDTPPCFIWHTWDDEAVPLENSMVFADALRKAGVKFDFHIYEKGQHGIGLGENHPWASQCMYWLETCILNDK